MLLGFGNCGNAIQGLKSGDFELIVPRLDDCVSLVLGSQRYRERYSREHHAFYLTDGWITGSRTIEVEYNEMIEDYGEEEADELMNMMYVNYNTMAYLDTGLYDVGGVDGSNASPVRSHRDRTGCRTCHAGVCGTARVRPLAGRSVRARRAWRNHPLLPLLGAWSRQMTPSTPLRASGSV